METVRQLLDRKGSDTLTIDVNATVFEALELMAEHNVGALVVTQGDRIAGILSERDYARKIILKGRFSRDTPVSEIMTEDVATIDPDRPISACMSSMTDKRIRHLPVVESGRLAGIISIGDVVRSIIEDQQFTIEQLENYIASG